ncbi:PEPxxWA-CTERM sorting domain-containing protein [Sphingomonas trueperi]|uniref:PEPxxWA-CTERM sorting domain-containing protein n=1 Tax=Sphingomonas trueperi TaxID=53317 RepID=UPI000EB57526
MRKALLGAGVALLLSGTAHAQQHFKFSAHLTSTPGSGVVTGTFDGTLNGNLITNLSNIYVFVDGAAFNSNGALYNFAFNLSDTSWTGNAAVASLDGTQNNFLFSDGDVANYQPYTGYFYSLSNYVDIAIMQSTSANFFANSPSSFRAELVPEPASWTLMIGGFGLVGAALRQRRSMRVRFA